MPHPQSVSGWSTWIVRIALTVLLFGILIVGIALVTLPMFSNTDWVKNSLMDILESSVRGSLHIDTLEVHLLPSPHITLTGLSFTSEPPGPPTSLQARQVEIAFAWDSLWEHKLVLTRGVMYEPELTLHLPRVTEPTEPAEWTFPAIRELAIHDGRIHLLKESATRTPATLTWEHIQLMVDGMEPTEPTTIQLTARSPDQERSSSWAFQGTLALIDLTDTPPATTRPGRIQPFTLRGQMEISHVPLGQWMAFLSDEPQASSQARISLQGEYLLTQSHDTDTLALPELHISLDDWSLTAQAHIVDLQTDSPLLLLSGTTTAITIQRLAHLLPPVWLPEAVRTLLVDRKVDGSLKLLTGSVQGRLNQQDPLVIEGVVRLEEGRLLTAPGHPPVTGLSGTLGFDSHLLTIQDARGVVAPFRFAVQEATLRMHDGVLAVSIPNFHVSEQDWALTGKARVTKTGKSSPVLTVSGSARPISIQHLVRLLPEAWLPAPIRTVLANRQVDGIMELVTGSVRWPVNNEERVEVDGVIRLEQGQILVDPNHPPLREMAGAMVFESNLVKILDFRGRLESSTLLVQDATLEFKDSDIWVDLQGGGDIFAQDAVQALRRDPRSQSLVQTLSDYRTIQGRLQIATRIEGPLTEPAQLRISQGSLAMEHVNFYPGEDRLPITSVTGRITFNHNRLNIHTLTGHLGSSPLTVTGQWDLRKESASSNLTIHATPAASDLLTLFPALSKTFSTFAGSLDTTLMLSGSTASPAYTLHIDLTNWALVSSGIITKPANIPGTFDATGHLHELDTLFVTQGELSLPPYKLDVQGSLAMQDPPRIRIGLRTESGTGALFPEGMILGDEQLGLSTLALSLTLQGEDRDWTAWNIQAAVESTNRVRPSNINGSDQGNKALRLTWLQKEQKAKADFSISNLLIERLLPRDLPPRFTGSLTFNTSVEMNLTWPEWTQRIMHGKGNLRLRNGRIMTSPVLSNIMNLLNVHNVLLGQINILESGFPVDQVFGTFTVENGVLSTKDLALTSPVLALAATGTYNIPTDQFDAIAAVSPFGAYTSLLKKIPLFGRLIEGERQGMTTALFEVKGPRTDPKVTYLPLQSLSGGIMGIAKFPLDVLKNVLTLPQSAIDDILQEDPAK